MARLDLQIHIKLVMAPRSMALAEPRRASLLLLSQTVAEWLLHYIPWREFLGGRDLPRPIAYALGVFGFALPLSIWLYEQDMTRMIFILWLAIVSAGLAVLSAYGADSVKALYWGKREANEELEMRRAQE